MPSNPSIYDFTNTGTCTCILINHINQKSPIYDFTNNLSNLHLKYLFVTMICREIYKDTCIFKALIGTFA